MREELDKELCALAPNLYADRHGDITTSCMPWGFECGEGWFQIIRDLSIKLEELILKAPEEYRPMYKASQVKEKFGSLRFYMHSGTDEMYDLIEDACSMSEMICETCGEPGRLIRAKGWLRTTCDRHL